MSTRPLPEKPLSRWNEKAWGVVRENMLGVIQSIDDVHADIRAIEESQKIGQLRTKKILWGLTTKELSQTEIENQQNDIIRLRKTVEGYETTLQNIKSRNPNNADIEEGIRWYGGRVTDLKTLLTTLQGNVTDELQRRSQKQVTAEQKAQQELLARQEKMERKAKLYDAVKSSKLKELETKREGKKNQLFPLDNMTTMYAGLRNSNILSNAQALALLRKRELCDEFEVQIALNRSVGETDLEVPATIGKLNSMLKEGLLKTQAVGSAILDGAETVVGGTIDGAVNGVVWFIGWPLLGPSEIASMGFAFLEKPAIAWRLKAEERYRKAGESYDQSSGFGAIIPGIKLAATWLNNNLASASEIITGAGKDFFNMKDASINKKVGSIAVGATIIATLLILTPFTFGLSAIPLALIMVPAAITVGVALLAKVADVLGKAWNKFRSSASLKLTPQEENDLLLWEQMHPDKSMKAKTAVQSTMTHTGPDALSAELSQRLGTSVAHTVVHSVQTAHLESTSDPAAEMPRSMIRTQSESSVSSDVNPDIVRDLSSVTANLERAIDERQDITAAPSTLSGGGDLLHSQRNAEENRDNAQRKAQQKQQVVEHVPKDTPSPDR